MSVVMSGPTYRRLPVFRPPPLVPTPEERRPYTRRMARVLVVEDDEAVSLLIAKTLENHRWIAYAGSTQPTHAVDITDQIDAGIASLECHRVYIEGLGDPDFDPAGFLRGMAESAGPLLGVELAVGFELVPA